MQAGPDVLLRHLRLGTNVSPSGTFVPRAVLPGVGPRVLTGDLSYPASPWVAVVGQPAEEAKAGGVVPAAGARRP